MGKINNEFQVDISKRIKNTKYITQLPPNGLAKDDILKHLNDNLELGTSWWKFITNIIKVNLI